MVNKNKRIKGYRAKMCIGDIQEGEKVERINYIGFRNCWDHCKDKRFYSCYI